VQPLAQGAELLVGHHGEVESDRLHAQGLEGGTDTRLDLGAQRAPDDREGDGETDPSVGADNDVAHHPELDDRTVQLRVLDGLERVDHLVTSGGHGWDSSSTAPADLHYGDR